MSPLPRISHDEDDPEATTPETIPPSSSFRCFGCGVASPPTRTGETLVSSRHGWRAERVELASGQVRVDWRCAKCWSEHRYKKLSPLG